MSSSAAVDDLVDRWVTGWGISRSMPVAAVEGVARAWRAEVGSESRSIEYVASSPTSADASRLAELIAGHADRWLTIGGPHEADLSRLDRVTHVETFMVGPVQRGATLGGVSLEVEGSVAHARIELEGQVAARGQVAVRGADAVIDKITTEEPFRRRGLGREIMVALSDWAASRGAVHGILLASQSGVKLYASLGWSTALPAVTYRGAPLPDCA